MYGTSFLIKQSNLRCVELTARAGITLLFKNESCYAWELPEIGSISISFCLYLGQIQGKSPRPNEKLVGEIGAFKGSNLR